MSHESQDVDDVGTEVSTLALEEVDRHQSHGKVSKKKKNNIKMKEKVHVEEESKDEAPATYQGVIVVRQEGFGFIKSPGLESRIYFCTRDADKKCHNGSKVEFVLDKDPKSGKPMAKSVKLLDNGHSVPGGVQVDIPGIFTGIVQALPNAPVDVHVDDGMISFYYDADGCQQQAMFGTWRVAPGEKQPSLGQPVQFNLAQNPQTKVFKALNVSLDRTAVKAAENASSLGSHTDRQVGKVVLLKKEFGFVKQLYQTGDLFFHFSEIDKTSIDKLKVGDDVEFSIKSDKDGRPCACEITRAPPGTVAFEICSDSLYHGVILEKPAISKSYEKSPGVIDFVEEPLDPLKHMKMNKKHWNKAVKTKLLFYANESDGIQSLRRGDHVLFKIVTDLNSLAAAKTAGKDVLADLIARRATQVQPVKGIGTIVDLRDHTKGSKGFGFVLWSGSILHSSETPSGDSIEAEDAKFPQQRLFFHKTDLQSSENFQIGDTVYFTLHSNKNSDDLAATRIRMKSKATQPQADGHATPVPDELASQIPSKLQHRRLQASSKGNQSASKAGKLPRGPDGTRGFAIPRATSYLDSDVSEDVLLGLCCGMKLRGIFSDMPRTLSVEAIPFNPLCMGS